jgi:predicted ester cyclase
MPAATPASSDLMLPRVASQRLDPRSVGSAPATEMNRLRMILLLGAALLGVLGGTALLLAVVTEVPATARSDSVAENEAIARRFYAAVNDAVRTGDLSLLDHVMVAHTDHMPDTVETVCEVRCRVSALHRLAPDVRLQIDDLLVDGERVAAHLSIRGNDRPVLLGLVLQGDLAPWGPVDFLRVNDGKIVEVQPAADLPSLVEPLGRAALKSVPTAPYRLGLVRLTLEPSTAIPALSTEGPVFLLVERGTLIVHVNQPSRVQMAGPVGNPGRDELRAAGAITLSSGERIALDANTGYALRSTGNEAAVVLSAAALAGEGGPTNRWVRARSFEEILFNPGEREVVQTGASSSWPPGVRSDLLAYGIIKTRPVESATLELTRVTLAPNAALPVHDTSAEMLAVDSGTAVDLVAGDGAIRPRPRALQKTIWTQRGSSARNPRLTEGGAAVLQPGSSLGVRNVGNERLVLLILTLEPKPGLA